MSLDVVDVSKWSVSCGLEVKILGLRKIDPSLDINLKGLLMHGSEADPYTILTYGLVPQKTGRHEMEDDWQVCLGLSSDKPSTIEKNMSRKNSAVKYAGYFSEKGLIYILSEDVKEIKGYHEFWDEGEHARGYAWVSKPIPPSQIIAVISENIQLASAAVIAAKPEMHIYRVDGSCYRPEQL